MRNFRIRSPSNRVTANASVGWTHLGQQPPQPVKVGETAPTFTLATLNGEEISLADLKGQIVVLDFWATWCGPCRKGLPEVQKVVDWIAAEKLPVKVFAVDVMGRRLCRREDQEGQEVLDRAEVHLPDTSRSR